MSGERKGARHGRGFTLIELMVVMAVLATLLTIAIPRYMDGVTRSREAALKETLRATREAIDKYSADTGRYPESLDDLVTKRYLRKPPVDPITDDTTTWIVIPPPQNSLPGKVSDLRSGATGQALDGTEYGEW